MDQNDELFLVCGQLNRILNTLENMFSRKLNNCIRFLGLNYIFAAKIRQQLIA